MIDNTLEDILELVREERARQGYLLKEGIISYNCSSPETTEERKLTILVEEVGEVAKAILDKEGDARLLEELIQVAAVSIGIAQSIYERKNVLR